MDDKFSKEIVDDFLKAANACKIAAKELTTSSSDQMLRYLVESEKKALYAKADAFKMTAEVLESVLGDRLDGMAPDSDSGIR